MGRKLLSTTPVGSKCSVKIYKDSEYGVFVVKGMVGAQSKGEYETDDRGDANGTAKATGEWLAKQKGCLTNGTLQGARRRRRKRR
jgi:hypothetical protein